MLRFRLQGLGHASSLVLAGHLLGLAALFGALSLGTPESTILVTGILGAAYLILAWRTGESAHLYPGAVLLGVSYLSYVGQFAMVDSMLLWALPFQIACLGAGAWLRRKDAAAHAVPFEAAAHVVALILIGQFLLFDSFLTAPSKVVASLFIVTVIDLGLTWLHRKPWFLFPSGLFFALGLLFLMRHTSAGPPDNLLVYFTAIALAYALLSFFLRRSQAADHAEPLEGAALLIALMGASAGLFRGDGIGLNAVLAGALAFGTLFAASRGREYIYLVMLSAGAIGMLFVRITGGRFSPQLVDQFLLGMGIVGLLFLYPTVRGWIQSEGSLQQWFVEQRWVRVLLVGLPLAILIPAIGVSYTFEATANPTFCGSCHVMETQFQAWDRGSHKDVTCDTCHYPPGAEHFVQGKVVGLVEVINNAAGTYGTKLHGTVDNANCEDCHPSDELIGAESPYRAKVYFNHRELEPGKGSGLTMRCNNCHAHIVDGYHFQVRESTCYWCHFMGQEEQETVVGDCFTCHSVPRDSVHLGAMPIEQEAGSTVSGCQAEVTVGDGAVRPERCLACHSIIPPSAGEAQAMHDLHIVSETTFLSRKVECIECHDEIQHGEETYPVPFYLLFGP